jgi:hypothetical protein
MIDWSKFQEGCYYKIQVACSSEGEYSDEISKPFLCQFHRVIGDFEDAEGNVSQHPIEWFENVKDNSHYSCDVVSAKLCLNQKEKAKT